MVRVRVSDIRVKICRVKVKAKFRLRVLKVK